MFPIKGIVQTNKDQIQGSNIATKPLFLPTAQHVQLLSEHQPLFEQGGYNLSAH